MKTYLAIGISFDSTITNSTQTNFDNPQDVNVNFTKEFEYPLDFFDTIFLIDNNEVVRQWFLDRDY